MFAAIIKYNPLHHNFEGLSDIGEGSASGLISYYKIFAPLQFIIAVLTQYLIIMPLWDRILRKHKSAFTVFTCVILVCAIAAAGLSYVIWDRTMGAEHLKHITLFMTGVQVLYWAINFLMLAILDWRELQRSGKADAESTKPEKAES
jgi:predicted permease